MPSNFRPNFNQMGEAKPGIFRPLNLYTGSFKSHEFNWKWNNSDLSNPTSQRNVQIWRLDAPLHFANAPKLIESVAEICQQIASTHASDSMTDIKIVSNDSSDLKVGKTQKECAFTFVLPKCHKKLVILWPDSQRHKTHLNLPKHTKIARLPFCTQFSFSCTMNLLHHRKV